jgi:hypothetical protein
MTDRPRGRLVLNPTLQLRAVVDVAQRGRGRHEVQVADTAALRFLLAATRRRGRLAQPRGALRRRLREQGILIRPAEVPGDVRLDPRLRTEAGARATSQAGLRLARDCRLQRGAPRTSDTEAFLPDGEILWACPPDSGISLPYTLGATLAGPVRDLLRGRRDVSSLPAAVAAALERIGALDPPGGRSRRRAAWLGRLRDWRRELRATGYVVLRGLFSPVFLAAVRDYYRRLLDEGYAPRAEQRRGGAPMLYDEPLLGFLADRLAPVVARITGERASPTFAFLREYEPGAILASHRDKAVCRWNVDMVLGGVPWPERRNAWPLWIGVRGGARAVRLGLGDGLLYPGTDLRHWRRAQPPRQTTVLACLHYGAARRS